jgi:dihydroneopterin aldolase
MKVGLVHNSHMWTVFIEGLEIYAYHGVPDAEQEIGHRYRVGCRVLLADLAAPWRDDVAQTVDYDALSKAITTGITSKRYRTVEALAWAVAGDIFTAFEAVDSLELAIEKIAPPMPVIADSAGVEVSLSREDWKRMRKR